MSSTPMRELLPFSWRTKQYPLRRIRLSIAHDLVVHKPWGLNGARVEGTGQAPVRIHATMPFHNTIASATNENWQSGKLYPEAFREFILDFQLGKTGLVGHPEFGGIACKAETLEFELAAEGASGVDVEASWIETLDEEVVHQIANGMVDLDSAAIDLDGQIADLSKLLPQLPVYKETLEDLARAIQGVGDQVALLQYQAAGRINSLVYRAEQIQGSVDRARSALTWPTTQAIERIKSAANDLRGKLLQANRDIVLYRVPEDTTVAALMPSLPGAKLADVIKLNPSIVAQPIVEKNTDVRYYTPRAA